MKIKVKFFGPFFYWTDCKEITLNIPQKSTINELLVILAARLGDFFNKKVTKEALNNKALQRLIWINNCSIFNLKKLETKIKENDTISFLPPMAGG